MAKNGNKNFVNQFKNTRRQVGRQAAVPLWDKSYAEQKKRVKGTVFKPKRYPLGERKADKDSGSGGK